MVLDTLLFFHMSVGVNADRTESRQVAYCCIIADQWNLAKSQRLSKVRGDTE